MAHDPADCAALSLTVLLPNDDSDLQCYQLSVIFLPHQWQTMSLANKWQQR